jgi:hypothetical protein
MAGGCAAIAPTRGDEEGEVAVGVVALVVGMRWTMKKR